MKEVKSIFLLKWEMLNFDAISDFDKAKLISFTMTWNT